MLNLSGPEHHRDIRQAQFAQWHLRHANASDKNKFEMLLGKGSLEKGTVWIGDDGCGVKLVLDEGIRQVNGGVN